MIPPFPRMLSQGSTRCGATAQQHGGPATAAGSRRAPRPSPLPPQPAPRPRFPGLPNPQTEVQQLRGSTPVPRGALMAVQACQLPRRRCAARPWGRTTQSGNTSRSSSSHTTATTTTTTSLQKQNQKRALPQGMVRGEATRGATTSARPGQGDTAVVAQRTRAGMGPTAMAPLPIPPLQAPIQGGVQDRQQGAAEGQAQGQGMEGHTGTRCRARTQCKRQYWMPRSPFRG